MDAQQMVTVGLLVILGILALIFLAAFVKDLLAHKDSMEKESNTLISSAIGLGINFSTFSVSVLSHRVLPFTRD